jgi:hypothetical protein
LFSRLFRKSSSPKIDPVWWQAADAAAEAPTGAAVDSLAVSLTPTSAASDELERQQEMLSGLRDLVELASSDTLPVINTQHRAIGQDACHFIAPVSLAVEGGGAGKIFLTSARLVFVGGRLRSWPWHRVRKITRAGRNLLIIIAGEGEDLLLQCNTYSEALVARYFIQRLAPGT